MWEVTVSAEVAATGTGTRRRAGHVFSSRPIRLDTLPQEVESDPHLVKRPVVAVDPRLAEVLSAASGLPVEEVNRIAGESAANLLKPDRVQEPDSAEVVAPVEPGDGDELDRVQWPGDSAAEVLPLEPEALDGFLDPTTAVSAAAAEDTPARRGGARRRR